MNLLNDFKNYILSKKIQIYLVLYLFIFLYAPPILVDFNIVFILFIFSFILIIKNYKIEIKSIFKNLTIKRFFIGIILYSIYFLLILGVNLCFFETVNLISYLTVIYSYILFFPITLICSLYVICLCIRNKITLDNLIKYFICACLIQTGIAILALVFRDFKEIVLQLMYKHTGDDLLITPWLNHRRFFGFSRNLLDLFGLGTGILCGIVILQIRNHKKYIYLVPFIILLTLLNSKTGLVIIAISFILLFFDKKNRKLIFVFFSKYKYYILIVSLISIFTLCFFIPETIEWVINDFLSFLPNSNNKGIASLLFSKDFWTFPDNIFAFLFGTGHNIFAVDGFVHSDIGYVNEIWKTGIIGFFLLYGNILILFYTLFKSQNYLTKYLGLLFAISLLIFMIKGQVIGYNPATPLIFTISLYACIEKGKN